MLTAHDPALGAPNACSAEAQQHRTRLQQGKSWPQALRGATEKITWKQSSCPRADVTPEGSWGFAKASQQRGAGPGLHYTEGDCNTCQSQPPLVFKYLAKIAWECLATKTFQREQPNPPFLDAIPSACFYLPLSGGDTRALPLLVVNFQCFPRRNCRQMTD